MGSLALLLKEAGYLVSGSDENVYPPMSTQLEGAGIKLMQGYRAENVHIAPPYTLRVSGSLTPSGCKVVKPDLVIIGNVISRGNLEAEEVLSQNLKYMSMPAAVGELFLKDRHSIVVAGTHGKTTTSTLCAWLLDSIGQNPGFLIGGVGLNFNCSARIGKKPFFVIEGDEYDTAFFDKGPKFLHYRPKSVILGPIEFDHADIYRDLDHVMSSFEKLVAIIPEDGLLLACADSENTLKIAAKAKCKVKTYGISKKADYHPEDVKVLKEGTAFKISVPSPQPSPIKGEGVFIVPMYGNHNLQNTIGVLGLLKELGIDLPKIEKGLKTFKNVRRRQEVRGVVRGVTVIDDFAHHPTAIKETIYAMKMRYPNAKIWSIFEPRSNTSKRNIFQAEFAKAFENSDVAVIAHLFKPEKVAEADRLDVGKLIFDIGRNGIRALSFPTTEDIVNYVAGNVKSGDVVLVMSNGGFDNIHEKILNRI